MAELLRLPLRLWATLREGGLRGALWRSAEYLSVKLRRRGLRVPAVRPMRPPPPPDPAGWDGPAEPPPGWPVISLLMPVHDTPPDVLDAAIRSVVTQTYPGWELCICDDASTAPGCLAELEDWRGFDPRLKITRSDAGLHIAGATNAAALFATGAFVGFLDHDDLLTPDALQVMAEAIVAHPDADVLYSDEDKLEPDGTLSEPYLKPDWSPEHLQSVPYLLHLMLVRKSLFLALGGLRDRYTGAQDYDLSLRATAAARRVVHVPRVLYHWRKLPGSAAAEVDAKPQALRNARAALTEFVATQDPAATVTDGLFPGSHRVGWSVDRNRPVTLLMLTAARRREVEGRGDLLLVEHAARSVLERTTFQNRRLLILDNGPMPAETRAGLERLGAEIVPDVAPKPFNFSAKANRGFALVETEDVVLLNDDVEVIAPDWLDALLAHSRREPVGAAGAKLLYPNGRVQHAGVVTGVRGPTVHLFHDLPGDEPGYNGYAAVVRNVSAVTGAVLATRMSLVRALGGFDEGLAIDFNDVDFCFRLQHELGKRIVWTPHALLHHFEGSSLARQAVSPEDEAAFLARWGDRLDPDPFYNPGLPRDRLDCHVTRW